MLGVLGIIISLALLMYFAYKGVSVIILTPILALVAVILGGSLDLLPVYTETYMFSLANYVRTYFPIFLLGAIFGKVMDSSGAAKCIANTIASKLGKEKAIIAVVLSCAILTYGGVSLFVVAFAVYPIAVSLFKAAGVPKRLIPGAIALGSFTFTMTSLPGTPQVQNAIPMPYFGTDTWASPIIGVVGSLVMGVGGCAWLMYRAKKAILANEPFTDVEDKKDAKKLDNSSEELSGTSNNFLIAILPILIVLVLNFLLSKFVFVETFRDWGFLEAYKTTIKSVGGTWSLIISLLISILVCIFTNYKKFNRPISVINEGANGSLLAILNTAAAVGYGNVISSLAAFGIVKNSLLGISDNPLIAEGISVTTLAGITGSASGGISIALDALGENLIQLANNSGIDLQVLHRIATIACGGLDSLPHNGAVITLLAVCGLTHKKSYFDIMIVSVVIPLIALAVAIVLGSIGIV